MTTHFSRFITTPFDTYNKIDLKTSVKIEMLFLMNSYYRAKDSETWGFTAIYATDDTDDVAPYRISELTKCSGYF